MIRPEHLFDAVGFVASITVDEPSDSQYGHNQ